MSAETLWELTDLCDFFKMGKTTINTKIIADPDFPKPIKIGKTRARYVPAEVKRFAERKRG